MGETMKRIVFSSLLSSISVNVSGCFLIGAGAATAAAGATAAGAAAGAADGFIGAVDILIYLPMYYLNQFLFM
jgi:fluoride ion exporter CrcB/FEX